MDNFYCPLCSNKLALNEIELKLIQSAENVSFFNFYKTCKNCHNELYYSIEIKAFKHLSGWKKFIDRIRGCFVAGVK